MVHKLTGALTLGAALLLSTSAFAQDKRVVTWNADYDPIPLAAAEALIADFEAANPEIDVQLTNFDHEAYKNAIRAMVSLAEANDFGSTEELTLTYNNIGIAFYDQKKYNVALEMHKKALRLQQEKLGDKHPDVILTCKYK